MDEFNVGETVLVAPDFSNDDFEPFVGEVVEVDAPGDPNPIFYIKDEEGNVEPWMSGNVRKHRKPGDNVTIKGWDTEKQAFFDVPAVLDHYSIDGQCWYLKQPCPVVWVYPEDIT